MDISGSLKNVTKFATSKPVLWGVGALVVLGGGYWLLTNGSNGSASSANSSGAADLSSAYSVPVSYQSNGQVAMDTSANTGSDYTSALVALETQKAGYDYSASLASLNSQTILGLVGAQTAQAAIASTNYQTSANTLNNFLKSGYNGLVGSITGPDGAQTNVNLAASTPGGKGSANAILDAFYRGSASQSVIATQNNPAPAPASNGATSDTNQLVTASLATLVHNGGLGLAA